jgi:uncharacterized protein YbjT (DUF2867 family)
MTRILVTGGTGALGRPTVDHLLATGHQVRILSRRPDPGGASADQPTGRASADQPTGRASSHRPTGAEWVTGDLTTGVGLPAAVAGVGTIVHLATSLGRRDIQHARNLLAVTPRTTHLVLMSIAGIDRIPMPYYRTKLAVERLIADSGRPYTILRATQFHNLLDRIFTAERFLPALLAPAITLQPIAVEDVAVRLTELVDEPPAAGRAPDIGGPERRPAPDLARAWSSARKTAPARKAAPARKGAAARTTLSARTRASGPVAHRRVVPIRVPGKAFRAFASGGALVDGPPYGRITFEDYLGATS